MTIDQQKCKSNQIIKSFSCHFIFVSCHANIEIISSAHQKSQSSQVRGNVASADTNEMLKQWNENALPASLHCKGSEISLKAFAWVSILKPCNAIRSTPMSHRCRRLNQSLEAGVIQGTHPLILTCRSRDCDLSETKLEVWGWWRLKWEKFACYQLQLGYTKWLPAIGC